MQLYYSHGTELTTHSYHSQGARDRQLWIRPHRQVIAYIINSEKAASDQNHTFNRNETAWRPSRAHIFLTANRNPVISSKQVACQDVLFGAGFPGHASGVQSVFLSCRSYPVLLFCSHRDDAVQQQVPETTACAKTAVPTLTAGLRAAPETVPRSAILPDCPELVRHPYVFLYPLWLISVFVGVGFQ